MMKELESAFSYDPESGELTRLSGKDSGVCGADRGGVLTFDHTFRDGIQRRFFVHRVAFYLSTGRQPLIVDHIDGNRLNNKLLNLREATYSQNNHNRGVKGSHTTISEGLRLGVSRVLRPKGRVYFQARIKVGERVLRKTCKSYLDACHQRISWEIEHFGEFSAFNRGLVNGGGLTSGGKSYRSV